MGLPASHRRFTLAALILGILIPACIPFPPLIPTDVEIGYAGIILKDGHPLEGALVWSHEGIRPVLPVVFPIEKMHVTQIRADGTFILPPRRGLPLAIPLGPYDVSGCGGLTFAPALGGRIRWNYSWGNTASDIAVICELGETTPTFSGCIAFDSNGIFHTYGNVFKTEEKSPLSDIVSPVMLPPEAKEPLNSLLGERLTVELREAVRNALMFLANGAAVSRGDIWPVRVSSDDEPTPQDHTVCPRTGKNYRDPAPVESMPHQ